MFSSFLVRSGRSICTDDQHGTSSSIVSSYPAGVASGGQGEANNQHGVDTQMTNFFVNRVTIHVLIDTRLAAQGKTKETPTKQTEKQPAVVQDRNVHAGTLRDATAA